ncbi:hypothetical protein M419DRAFT_8464 [Trichoderma reesei RUT C-30]|uniref:Uncharacterized protein n=1 Tax=Hypocrea jecorina (strain ATCC 56765 / BCRC 32924 / NRRL 11460 / Rut C-30) TaxID=1344414 RepID=A0A024SC50_HYPJR|nr:hypothetical protein M419DRAFT_8464 [Trichoderma reesei RUT C-30]
MAIIDMDFGPAPTFLKQLERCPSLSDLKQRDYLPHEGCIRSSFEDPVAQAASGEDPKPQKRPRPTLSQPSLALRESIEV